MPVDDLLPKLAALHTIGRFVAMHDGRFYIAFDRRGRNLLARIGMPDNRVVAIGLRDGIDKPSATIANAIGLLHHAANQRLVLNADSVEFPVIINYGDMTEDFAVASLLCVQGHLSTEAGDYHLEFELGRLDRCELQARDFELRHTSSPMSLAKWFLDLALALDNARPIVDAVAPTQVTNRVN